MFKGLKPHLKYAGFTKRIMGSIIVWLIIFTIYQCWDVIYEKVNEYFLDTWFYYNLGILGVLCVIHVLNKQSKDVVYIENDRTCHHKNDFIKNELKLTQSNAGLFLETALMARYCYRQANWLKRTVAKLLKRDKQKINSKDFTDIKSELAAKGWHRLESESLEILNNSISGIHVDVWRNHDRVVIAYKGTYLHLFTLLSNLHWVLKHFIVFWKVDQYDVIKNHMPDIINEIKGNDKLELYCAGHSLGAGLAIHTSYFVEDIREVYAYDPSPVTGWTDIKRSKRKRSSEDLLIHKFYESGEVLYYLRRLTQLSYLLNTTANRNPHFIEYRVDFHKGYLPIQQHGMKHIVEGLRQWYQ